MLFAFWLVYLLLAVSCWLILCITIIVIICFVLFFFFWFWVFFSSSSPSLCLSRTWNDYYAKLNTIHLWTYHELNEEKKNNKKDLLLLLMSFGSKLLALETKMDEFTWRKYCIKCVRGASELCTVYCVRKIRKRNHVKHCNTVYNIQ